MLLVNPRPLMIKLMPLVTFCSCKALDLGGSKCSTRVRVRGTSDMLRMVTGSLDDIFALLFNNSRRDEDWRRTAKDGEGRRRTAEDSGRPTYKYCELER